MNRINQLVFSILLGLVLWVGYAQTAPAPSGRFSGLALGPTHKGIPGITVTILREGAASQETVTSYGGEFSFSHLDPGQYRISATLEGIMESKKVPIVVQPGKTARSKFLIGSLSNDYKEEQ